MTIAVAINIVVIDVQTNKVLKFLLIEFS